jgi:uncharacterized membrane protein
MQPQPDPAALVVATWNRPATAERALHDLRAVRHAGMVGIPDAATIVLEPDGALRVTDTRDLGAGRGAAVRGVVGAGLGLLTAGAGWLPVSGMAIGALVVRARDGGLRSDRLVRLGELLAPRSSGLVACVELPWIDDVVSRLVAARGAVVLEPLSAALLRRLDVGTWSIFSASHAEGDVLAVRSTAPVMRALDELATGMA